MEQKTVVKIIRDRGVLKVRDKTGKIKLEFPCGIAPYKKLRTMHNVQFWLVIFDMEKNTITFLQEVRSQTWPEKEMEDD